ncbi:MAG: tetratricopeptide repeat protein [Flavicella sp.]
MRSFIRVSLKKTFFFGIICMALTIQSNAQETNTLSVNVKSYQLYEKQQWSELIAFGEEALQNETDYFYLRMRIGIAYYEKKNYALAQIHFRKALEFNSTDILAQEYLYYCYVFTGKQEEARLLSRLFSQKLKSIIGISNKSAIEEITLETAQKSPKENYINEGGTAYFQNATYIQLGLKHNLKNKFSLFHAATYYSQKSNIGDVKQTQYYLQATIPLKNQWTLQPAIHLINTKYTNALTSVQNETSDNSFLASFSLSKRIKKTELTVGTTYTDNPQLSQNTYLGRIAYAPLGNSKIILGYTHYTHSAPSNSVQNNSKAPYLYFEPSAKSSIKVSYLDNENSNIAEDNGYLINNAYHLTENRLALLLDFDISKSLTVYGMYQYEQKTHRLVERFDFDYNLYLLGLKFRL